MLVLCVNQKLTMFLVTANLGQAFLFQFPKLIATFLITFAINFEKVHCKSPEEYCNFPKPIRNSSLPDESCSLPVFSCTTDAAKTIFECKFAQPKLLSCNNERYI